MAFLGIVGCEGCAGIVRQCAAVCIGVRWGSSCVSRIVVAWEGTAYVCDGVLYYGGCGVAVGVEGYDGGIL